MLLTEAIVTFLSTLETERDASSHTVTAYRIALEQFEVFCTEAWGEVPQLEELTERDVRPFL